MVNNKYRIVDVAFELSLKHGFDSVSMKQIQDETGLSAGVIYYHFKSKDEILEYMINRYLLDSFETFKKEVKDFDGSFMEKIEFIFNYKAFHFVENEYSEAQTLNNPQFSRKDYFPLITGIYHNHHEIREKFYQLHDDLYDFYYEMVKEAIKNNEIRGDIKIRMLVMFIQSIFKGYADLWVFQPNFSFEELVDANLKMIHEAIKK